MTRNRFNQTKNQGASSNNLIPIKARGFFPEDNDNIGMENTYKITNVNPPIDGKDVVTKEYCDNKLLSSSNKIDILGKNITEVKKNVTMIKLQLKHFI